MVAPDARRLTRGRGGGMSRGRLQRGALNVAVVGAGTAGPAAAVFLARAGHRVRVFERAPVNLPVGAGAVVRWDCAMTGLRWTRTGVRVWSMLKRGLLG